MRSASECWQVADTKEKPFERSLTTRAFDRLLTIDKPVVATIGRAGGKDGLARNTCPSLTAQLCLSRRYVQSVVCLDLYDHPRSLVEHGGMVDAQGGKPGRCWPTGPNRAPSSARPLDQYNFLPR